MKYSYYTLNRPPMPGGIPKKPIDLCAWDERMPVENGKRAWGMVVYDRELTKEEIEEYELMLKNGGTGK